MQEERKKVTTPPTSYEHRRALGINQPAAGHRGEAL